MMMKEQGRSVNAGEARRFGLPCGVTLELLLACGPDAESMAALVEEVRAADMRFAGCKLAVRMGPNHGHRVATRCPRNSMDLAGAQVGVAADAFRRRLARHFDAMLLGALGHCM